MSRNVLSIKEAKIVIVVRRPQLNSPLEKKLIAVKKSVKMSNVTKTTLKRKNLRRRKKCPHL